MSTTCTIEGQITILRFAPHVSNGATGQRYDRVLGDILDEIAGRASQSFDAAQHRAGHGSGM